MTDSSPKLSQGRKLPVGPDGFNERERELLNLLAKGFNVN